MDQKSVVRSIIVACALALTAPARAEVLRVAFSGGDYNQIQDAVAAAVDGDVVLVQGAGLYQPVRIDGKGITVVADTGIEVSIAGGIRVTNTVHSQTVTLVGLNSFGLNFGSGVNGALREGLLVNSCAGPVRVENCTFTGTQGLQFSTPAFGATGVIASYAPDFAIVDCALRGGDGAFSSGNGGAATAGGSALEAYNFSNIAVYDSEFIGGTGAGGDTFGGNGGRGISLADSTLFLSNCGSAGGNGGSGFFSCAPGGDGLFASGTASVVTLVAEALTGGLGACGTPNGLPVSTANGAGSNSIGSVVRSVELATPVREGSTAQIEFKGQPGDHVYLLISSTPGYDTSLPFNGVLLLQQPFSGGRRFMGVMPTTGTMQVTVQNPTLEPQVEGLIYFIQAMFQEPQGVWFASPSNLVVLDAAL